MSNTTIDHVFAGKPTVREVESSLTTMTAVIEDTDPDSANIWLRMDEIGQLDALIHGLEALRRDWLEREWEDEGIVAVVGGGR